MAIPGESDYIYGFHDPGDWRSILTEKGRAGWVLVTEEIGHDPSVHSAPDYREWSDAGFGVLVRLNNGYSPNGSIPHSRNYDKFAQRCANHVADSKGAHIWIIGNEMNHANEQPGVRFDANGFTAEEFITPDRYAACFKKVRDRIKALSGHENDQVVLGAVAPYTAVLGYPGNEGKNWVKYFTDILDLLGTGLDGIALHTYTHGADPNLIFDEKQPWPQYPGLHYHFRAYRDFMKAIPPALRHLPVYITETDQSDDGRGRILPWADVNSGWVRNAYKEINDWNSTPGNQQIRCLLLYRWGRYDDWHIEGKRGVIDDMSMAAEAGYKWGAAPLAGGQPSATANDYLNVRTGPGTQFKRLGTIPAGAKYEIAGRSRDNAWLQIAYPDASGRGWISAQYARVTGDLGPIGVAGAPAQPAPAPAPSAPTPAPSLPPLPTPAAPAGEKLVVGGYTVTGDFLKFYRANAQLTGAPISNVVVENGIPIQYFESLALQAVAGGVRLAPIGRGLLDARRAMAEREKRAAQPGSGAGLSPERFGCELRDVTSTLPARPDKKWPRRSLGDIAFIVIHHTAAPGTLSPAGLARMMIDNQGKPSIKYHFYVTADGTVYQTLPLDALTDHAAGQSGASVGVALAGNFAGDALPTDAQLLSAGELCAWLIARLNLSASRIRGMSEIVPTHQSPGDQWSKGANWKERLLSVIESVIDSLRGQIPIALTVSVPQPHWDDRTRTLLTYNRLPAAEKKQGDSLEYPPRTLDSIRYLVLHHSATPPTTTVEQIADYQVRTQIKNSAGQVTKEQWPGIGYHFYITADGQIIKCNELTTVCYHVSGQNAASVGICFAGTFTPANAAPPNGKQLAAGGELIAYLMDQLNLEFDAIKGHQELESIDCPGQWEDGFAWRHMLMGAIGAKLTLSA